MKALLANTSILAIDCQTTGMRPSVGSLLEIAWNLGPAFDSAHLVSHLVELPPEGQIPWRVQEMTGIHPDEMAQAIPRDLVLEKLRACLEELSDRSEGPARVLIHYAQFEKPWLEDLLGGELPFEIVCTYQLTKKLFPHLPCRNIRGVSGFFGNRIGIVKRAGEHVTATGDIWRGLIDELGKRGITSWDQLNAWLAETQKKPAKKSAGPATQKKYEYRIAREKRLGLPVKPGVYRMLAKNGEVLYVGKATSLRDRVNSYFRGMKGRDPRKLEMLAQVWDLEVTECGSALEAALLETDEIKRYDPPYNVSLKRGKRKLIFYTRDFSKMSAHQDKHHPLGAFRTFNPIEDLRLLLHSLRSGLFLQVFHDTVPVASIEDGFQIFCARHSLTPENLRDMRSLLAFALRLYRSELRKVDTVSEAEGLDETLSDEDAADETSDETEELELTPQEVSEKFDRLFLRAGRELWRSRHLTKLLNADVSWTAETGERNLRVVCGKIGGACEPPDPEAPWRGLDISDYDRMSVLFSGISPREHRIVPLRFAVPLKEPGLQIESSAL